MSERFTEGTDGNDAGRALVAGPLDTAIARVVDLAELTSLDFSRILEELRADRSVLEGDAARPVEVQNAAYNAQVAPMRAQRYATLELQARCIELEREISALAALLDRLAPTQAVRELIRRSGGAGSRGGAIEDLAAAERTLSDICREAREEVERQADAHPDRAVRIVVEGGETPVPEVGVRLVAEALREVGRIPVVTSTPAASMGGRYELHLESGGSLAEEAYRIDGSAGDAATVTGGTPTGLLYGCVALAEAIRRGEDPSTPADGEAPVLELRATMMWPPIGGISGGLEAHSDWFYDPGHWLRFFDRLARWRLNLVALAHMHPYPHFVLMREHPEGRELSAAQLARNMGTFQWLIDSGAAHGVRMGTMNWNLNLTQAFVAAHGLQPHERSELTEDYTRAVTRELLDTYPEMGAIGFCPGEQVSGNRAEFLELTQLRALKEFHEDTGRTPLLLVRYWQADPEELGDTIRRSWDGPAWMDAKFNQEMVDISRRPDPDMIEPAKRSGVPVYGYFQQLSNLWPFTFGSPEFLRDCLYSVDDSGLKGVVFQAVNPEGWPYTWERDDEKRVWERDREGRVVGSYRIDPERYQFDRDWVWWSAFGRYGWDPRQPYDESFWLDEYERLYGSREVGEHVHRALDAAAVVMSSVGTQFWRRGWNHWRPQLNGYTAYVAHPWITIGGLLKDRPHHHLVADIPSYVDHVLSGKPLEEERTPVQIADSIVTAAATARQEIESAASAATSGHAEIERVRKEVEVLGHVAGFWDRRIRAAVAAETYLATLDEGRLDEADTLVQESAVSYRRLHDGLLVCYEIQPEIGGFARPRPDLLDFLLGEADKEARSFRSTFDRLGKELAEGPRAIMVHAGDTAPALEDTLAAMLDERGHHLAVLGGRVPDNLSRCRLLVLAHDMTALEGAETRRVLDWVAGGGRLLLWRLDAPHFGDDGVILRDFFPSPLRTGRLTTPEMAVADVDHPVIGAFSGRRLPATEETHQPNRLIVEHGPGWSVLAGEEGRAFVAGYPSGEGEIVVAQWPTGPYLDKTARTELAGNILAWAGL